MTVQMLQKMFKTDTENKDELLELANKLKNNKTIELSDYASLKANINMLNRPKPVAKNGQANRYYTEEEVSMVLKSHLEVYDGIKNIDAHLSYMKKLFGKTSSQYRNGKQYNSGFHRTLDTGNANLGHSMPSNWADGTLDLLQDRQIQFANTLQACKGIYDATGNQNMYLVIQKWSA